MKKTLLSLFLFLLIPSLEAKSNYNCDSWPKLLQNQCLFFHQVWSQGSIDLYLSGYAWHNRYTYPQHKIREYNELAWGGGLGKGMFDNRGNWRGLYALAFQDSHNHLEPALGYSFLKYFNQIHPLHLGIGYTVLVSVRRDVLNGYPLVGILPWVAVSYSQLSLCATYIPGAAGAGNVLYMVAKLSFPRV